MKLTLNRLIIALICTGNLILKPPIPDISLAAPPSTATPTATPTESRLQPTEIESRKIEDRARQITVKIFWGETTGSGILVEQESPQTKGLEYRYLVLTNNHVISNSNGEYRIETSDGRIYRAFPYPENQKIFGKNDLALVWFSSPHDYGKASLGKQSSLSNEDKVYVAGFPCQGRSCENVEFKFTSGAVFLLKKPLVRGYQVGYTNEATEGMSGGPVLNKKGEVVAIHGEGKYPLSSSKYEYEDGNKPNQDVVQFLKYFAWSIPLDTYNKVDTQNLFSQLPAEVTKGKFQLANRSTDKRSITPRKQLFPNILIQFLQYGLLLSIFVLTIVLINVATIFIVAKNKIIGLKLGLINNGKPPTRNHSQTQEMGGQVEGIGPNSPEQ